MKQQVLENILNKKIVAILRGLEYEDNFKVMETLIEAGITNFEVTLNTKKALTIIEEASKKYEKAAYVGAGTVKSKTDALQAIEAGAQFLISPNLSEECIEAALQKKVLIAPGVFSPTEIVKACELGCEIVKLFPAVALGAEYIKQLRGPLQDVKIMAVGGMDLSNMGAYIKAGVNAFGLGSCLVNTKLISEGRYDLLKSHFQEYVNLIS
ncbi:bifunctional 4-hydroxy-2-oxoglutarate aldolase/2-dehydro-3-deoxy-phosphogluconate aldolase [Cellulosilyticum sp. I15G10I2]|uniref:bifunctional 4-hydroxy-2-oxoglutarate aldolase/2-dehydro-3-deoxy-phosphogluconate aldolase n=1 Tax=Cellulosilyticum sp. I15G10I2 TaxID=1892843 RepID=UPI00085C9D76|nr:bifunctional 4-hydroxy-2-oxoglutarate aldolase/2-dehydro-3-deoxy-phosphogluconate aldolase [Cellulosilyticum sp. I15G10I2]